jgi:hypothetical protein
MLEDRLAPATVTDVAGVLTISNPRGALVVAVQSASGKVSVQDNGGSAVIYSNVGTQISITGNNLPSPNGDITFTGNTGFNGNLLINSANGAKTVLVNTAATAITNGNVTLIEGPGNSTTDLAGRIGGTLTYSHALGANTLATTGTVSVGGNATISNANIVNLPTAVTVGGSLSISGQTSGGTALNVTDTLDLTAKSLSVTGGGGSSSFADTAGVLTIATSATFNNVLSTSGTVNLSPAAGSFIGTNLYYTGGAGVDAVTLGANLIVGGNANINTGQGIDDLSGLNNAWTVGGNMSITEGNGDEGAFTVGGTVGGGLTISQGNGNNGQVTVANAPSGLMMYTGGNGTDSLQLGNTANPATWNVYLTFGTGTNTLTLNPSGLDTYTGTLNGSGGNDTFVQNGNTLVNFTNNGF